MRKLASIQKVITVVSGNVNKSITLFEHNYRSDAEIRQGILNTVENFNLSDQSIFIYTNNLAALYTINNCLLNYFYKSAVLEKKYWLNPDELDAYFLGDDGNEVDFLYQGADGYLQIDEGIVGETLGDLQIQFNHIMSKAANSLLENEK